MVLDFGCGQECPRSLLDSMSPPILIIEDEAALASALALLVKRLGREPVTAASATLGLEKLSKEKPALVILDIGLPDMSGLDALARIRKHDAELPVLIITAH